MAAILHEEAHQSCQSGIYGAVDDVAPFPPGLDQPGMFEMREMEVCAVSDPLILRIPGLGGLCHLSVEADGEAIWQAVWKVLLVSARLLSLGAETGGGQTR